MTNFSGMQAVAPEFRNHALFFFFWGFMSQRPTNLSSRYCLCCHCMFKWTTVFTHTLRIFFGMTQYFAFIFLLQHTEINTGYYRNNSHFWRRYCSGCGGDTVMGVVSLVICDLAIFRWRHGLVGRATWFRCRNVFQEQWIWSLCVVTSVGPPGHLIWPRVIFSLGLPKS